MNFNRSNIFHSVRWPLAIFLVTSWSRSDRISGPQQQNTQPSAIWGHRNYWNFYHLRSFVNFLNDNPMVQGRGCMRDATSLFIQAPIVSYVLLKMCETSHRRGVTRFLCDLPIQAFSLWLLLPNSKVVGSKHLSWSFDCLEAAQNTQHLCNRTKLTVWTFLM